MAAVAGAATTAGDVAGMAAQPMTTRDLLTGRVGGEIKGVLPAAHGGVAEGGGPEAKGITKGVPSADGRGDGGVGELVEGTGGRVGVVEEPVAGVRGEGDGQREGIP